MLLYNSIIDNLRGGEREDMFWCFCGGTGFGLLTVILGALIFAEHIGTILKVFWVVVLVSVVIELLYWQSMNESISPREQKEREEKFLRESALWQNKYNDTSPKWHK